MHVNIDVPSLTEANGKSLGHHGGLYCSLYTGLVKPSVSAEVRMC